MRRLKFLRFCFSFNLRQLSASFKTGFSELESARPALDSRAADRNDSFLVGEGRIELPISHPQRDVLPLYYSPPKNFIEQIIFDMQLLDNLPY